MRISNEWLMGFCWGIVAGGGVCLVIVALLC